MDALFKDKEEVSVDDFLRIKFSLTEALLHYEFYQFEVAEDDSISAVDFAKTLLSTLSFNKSNEFYKRIQTIELTGRVSFQEYVAFARFIDKSDILKMKICTYRSINF